MPHATQCVPALPEGARPETGPMRFEGDWTGVFIRGDNSLMGYLPAVASAISKLEACHPGDVSVALTVMQLQGLQNLLNSCAEGGAPALVQDALAQAD